MLGLLQKPDNATGLSLKFAERYPYHTYGTVNVISSEHVNILLHVLY